MDKDYYLLSLTESPNSDCCAWKSLGDGFTTNLRKAKIYQENEIDKAKKKYKEFQVQEVLASDVVGLTEIRVPWDVVKKES